MTQDVNSSGAEWRKEALLYYEAYYRVALGLPDWEPRSRARLKEEEVEQKHLDLMVVRIGPIEGRKVLNVGCGTGGFNVVSQRAGADSFGVETSKEALWISESKFQENGFPKGRFFLSGAEKMPFESGMFDIVYCFSVLEHVQSVPDSLHEMIRVLKPGGVLYLISPNSLNFHESHYKISWFPLFPRPLAKMYLKLLGRPTAFLDSLNYLTPGRLRDLLGVEKVIIQYFSRDISKLALKTHLKEKMKQMIGLGHIEWGIWKSVERNEVR